MTPEASSDLPRLEVRQSDGVLELRLEELRWQWMAKIRTIPGAIWDATGGRWTVPDAESTWRLLKARFDCEVHHGPTLPGASPSGGIARQKAPADGVAQPESPPLAEDPLREPLAAFDRNLRLRGRSPKTRKAYTFHVKAFARFVGQEFPAFDEEVIRAYLLRMLDEGRSRVYVNQAVSAIKSFCKEVLHSPQDTADIPRPKPLDTLPTVLSADEVLLILAAEWNVKHRAIIAITYAGGLRVSEVASLRIEDLDIARDMIHLKDAKGRKDRYTLLGEAALEAVRAYRKELAGAKGWLFPGQSQGTHLTSRSVQKAVRDAAKKAGLDSKHITPHTLRHSFATHLVENGVNLIYVQKLLGHRRPETTQRYVRVARAALERIRSPLDSIYDKRKAAPGDNLEDPSAPRNGTTPKPEGEPGDSPTGGVNENKVCQLKGRRFRIIRTKGFIR